MKAIIRKSTTPAKPFPPLVATDEEIVIDGIAIPIYEFHNPSPDINTLEGWELLCRLSGEEL